MLKSTAVVPPDDTVEAGITVAGVVTRSITGESEVVLLTTATVPPPITAATRATAAVPVTARLKRRGGSSGAMETF